MEKPKKSVARLVASEMGSVLKPLSRKPQKAGSVANGAASIVSLLSTYRQENHRCRWNVSLKVWHQGSSSAATTIRHRWQSTRADVLQPDAAFASSESA